MAKPWWRSKTVWFNVFMALVTIANEVLPLLDQFVAVGVPAQYADAVRPFLTLVAIVGNAVLRTMTKKPLAMR